MNALMKLPLRVELLPDESFLGYLARVSARNLLPSVNVIYEAFGMNAQGLIQKLGNAQVKKSEISRALGLSAERLDHLLPTQLEDDASAFRLHRLALKEHNYARRFRRVSPGSLKLSPHHRFSWLLADLGFCRESWEVLIDHCPLEHCKAPLSWAPKTGVHFCDRCGYDLRRATAQQIRPEDRAPLQFVADLVSLDELHVQRALMQVHPSMRHLNRGVLLQLVNVFGRAWSALNGETNTKKLKSVLCYPDLTVAGGRLLRGYPASLLEIIEKDHDAVMSDFFVTLKELTKSGLNKATSEFIRQMTAELRPIARSSLKGLALVRQGQDKITLREAATILGVENTIVRRFVKHRLLIPEHVRGMKRLVDWFDREEVYNLASSMKDRVALNAIHSQCHLPNSAIEQLVECGRLRWHPSEAVRLMLSNAYVVESEFRMVLQHLISSLKHFGKPGLDRVTLSACMALTGPSPKPWGPILDLALSGELPGGLGQIDRKYGFRASNLTVDLRVFRQIQFGEMPWQPLPEPDRQHCTLLEAEERLACNPMDITALIKAGLLKRVSKTNRRLLFASVLETAEEFMSSREIAARLGMTTEQLWGWTRKWGVEKPEGVSLWRRADLDAVLPPLRYGSDRTPRCHDSAEGMQDDEKPADGDDVLAA